MTPTVKNLIHRICGILTSLSLGAAAVLLCLGCLELYRADSFSREAVAAHFGPIAPAVYIALGLTALGFLLALVFPAQQEKLSPAPMLKARLKKARERADLSLAGPTLAADISAQRKRVLYSWIAEGIVLTLCAIAFFYFSLQSSSFTDSDINGSVALAMGWFIPIFLVSWASAVGFFYFRKSCHGRELTLLKQAPKKEAEAPAPRKSYLPVLKIGLVCLAAALLLLGYFTGGTADVLTKAVNICTECVGLG